MTGKKRLNPITGKEFVRGDVRADGRIFLAYKKTIKRDGTLGEQWALPEVIDRDRIVQKNRQANKRKNAKRDPSIPRRLNTLTNREFKVGDRDEKGRYFLGYRNYAFNDKYVHEEWASPERWHKHHLTQAYASAKKRAVKKGLPFEVTLEYVIEIFPKDFICPARRVPMFWATVAGRSDSPSLDRIKPELGYVAGNIIWVSFRANLIKNDATPQEILLVGNFYKTLEQK